jgi:hypothetical protein
VIEGLDLLEAYSAVNINQVVHRRSNSGVSADTCPSNQSIDGLHQLTIRSADVMKALMNFVCQVHQEVDGGAIDRCSPSNQRTNASLPRHITEEKTSHFDNYNNLPHKKD